MAEALAAMTGVHWLPVGYSILIGGSQEIGTIDESGRFTPTPGPSLLPVAQVDCLGNGSGLILPCRAEIETEQGEALVIVEFAVRRGRAVCSSLTATSDEGLRTSLLRAMPLAELAERTVRANLAELRYWQDELIAARCITAEAGSWSPPHVPSFRRELSPDFLAEVARVYREALASGLPPVQEVERRLGPTASARRWVRLARRRGHLGEAPGEGMRGEVT